MVGDWPRGLGLLTSLQRPCGPWSLGAPSWLILRVLGVCTRLIFKHDCKGDGGDGSYEVFQGYLCSAKIAEVRRRALGVHFSWTCPADLLKVSDLQVRASCFTGVPGCEGKMKGDLCLGILEILLTPKTEQIPQMWALFTLTNKKRWYPRVGVCSFRGFLKVGLGVTGPSLQPESSGKQTRCSLAGWLASAP